MIRYIIIILVFVSFMTCDNKQFSDISDWLLKGGVVSNGYTGTVVLGHGYSCYVCKEKLFSTFRKDMKANRETLMVFVPDGKYSKSDFMPEEFLEFDKRIFFIRDVEILHFIEILGYDNAAISIKYNKGKILSIDEL